MSEANQGTVVSVRGSVVDIRFAGHLPPIYSVLRAGAEARIVIEVQAQRDAHHVRTRPPRSRLVICNTSNNISRGAIPSATW